MILNTVLLDITTACDMDCPECCCAIHMHRPAMHHSLQYFEQAARTLRCIERLIWTGGEPTLHPSFETLAYLFRDLFRCKVMTLNSNGWGFERHAKAIADNFDWTDWSDYGIDKSAGIAAIRAHGGDVRRKDMVTDGAFIPRIRRTSEGKPCSRAIFRSGGFAYADGKLWGCSVSPGVVGAQGMEVCDGWQEKLLAHPLPCRDCFCAE